MTHVILLLVASALGGQAQKKEEPAPTYLSKEDDVAFTSRPVKLRLVRMRDLDSFYAPGQDKPEWSRGRKARRPEGQTETPPTLIALPLVYPPPERAQDRGKPVKDALQVAVTTNREGKKYINVERRGYDRRDRRCKLPPQSPRFAMYDKFAKPATVSQNNDLSFGPLWIWVRYASDPRVTYQYWLLLRNGKADSSYYEFRRGGYWEGKLPNSTGEVVRIAD